MGRLVVGIVAAVAIAAFLQWGFDQAKLGLDNLQKLYTHAQTESIAISAPKQIAP